MGLSCQSREVYDPLRKIWVAATPEEIVRQKLLLRMTEDLGYPKELLAVEKELTELPHLKEKNLPQRRIDILCFGKGIHPQHALYPLLLIECKKESLTGAAKEQLLGYNAFVGAYFVAAAGKDEILFGFPTPNAGYQFLSFLPPYAQLLAKVKNG